MGLETVTCGDDMELDPEEPPPLPLDPLEYPPVELVAPPDGMVMV